MQETWPDAKKMLSNPKLLELLKSYPKDKISEKQIKNVKKYVYNICYRTQGGAERLCASTHANDSVWAVLFAEATRWTACRYFKDPNLNVDNMASVSKAGKGLLVWVTAITKYYDVARNVEPLRIKVRTPDPKGIDMLVLAARMLPSCRP